MADWAAISFCSALFHSCRIFLDFWNKSTIIRTFCRKKEREKKRSSVSSNRAELLSAQQLCWLIGQVRPTFSEQPWMHPIALLALPKLFSPLLIFSKFKPEIFRIWEPSALIKPAITQRKCCTQLFPVSLRHYENQWITVNYPKRIQTVWWIPQVHSECS